MKFSGLKIDAGIPGMPLGKPIAFIVGSTRFLSFMRGQTLGGGGVSCMTQSRNAARTRFTMPSAGTGLARSVPRPQLFPGQLTGVLAGFSVVRPLPPPCEELGR